MVLQQETKAALWGYASEGSKISLTPSWSGKKYFAVADSKGMWTAYIDTPKASYQTHTIKIQGDSNSLIINDVLIGEVWLASGQSNMEMPIRGFYNCPVEGAAEVIAKPAEKNQVRFFMTAHSKSYEPLDEVLGGSWKASSPQTVSEFSATAYFFACNLNKSLDVPIGIVCSAYGGSKVESWLPKEICDGYEDIDTSRSAVEALSEEWLSPYMMYNAMLHPLAGYTVKGFIWYQGCSNVGMHTTYANRLSTMVDLWRKEWGDTECKLPFYQVEIAPYRYGSNLSQLLRQVQHDAAKIIPNCGIIGTNDLVYDFEIDQIHPRKKAEVGQRLAYMALNRNYGYSFLYCESPEAIKAYSKDGSIYVELSNCSNGMDKWDLIEGLEIAGSDGIFKPVKAARVEWNTTVLRVSSSEVANPVAVRYCWGDFVPGNLHNCEGLPLTAFSFTVE